MADEGHNRTAGTLSSIDVMSIVSKEDKKPYVLVSIKETGYVSRVMLTPEDTREQAYIMLKAADAAESDSFLMEFVASKLNITDDKIALAVLEEFRQFRLEKTYKPETRTVKS